MHSAEFLRCLVEVDVAGIRRLHPQVFPHLPAPASDDEALYSIHLARASMKRLHPRLRRYSRQWLAERQTGRVAFAVGIAVIAPPRRAQHALIVREAMQDAVCESVKAGVCLDTEADEVKRRMMAARDKA